MLTRLTIQNVVLIERLDLSVTDGFIALTGETGAGKSIVLDALGLALGLRAEARLVRTGTEQASVTAVFDLPEKHIVYKILQEKDITLEDATLILRRVVMPDGRSKAFLNDQPVGVQTLRDIGLAMIEIHGQFETQGLLDAATHRATLDAFAGLESKVQKLSRLWQDLRQAEQALATAKEAAAQAQNQEEFLRYAVDELSTLAPKLGEEQELATLRTKMLGQEKRQAAFQAASALLDDDDGLNDILGRLQQQLSKMDDPAIQDSLKRLKLEVEDLSWQLQKMSAAADDQRSLAEVEERYFALKEAARKHRVAVDELPALAEQMTTRLQLVTDQERAFAQMQAAVDRAAEDYLGAAKKISAERQKYAALFAKAVNAELPDLKLERAEVSVSCAPHTERAQWSDSGIDHVEFMVATNAGMNPGPLGKIASGGEMGRLMLAIKTVLASVSGGKTMVFDEVDSGIGGATAAAVGARIARLAGSAQVLVVTHSPQVAALATTHWRVEKRTQSLANKKESTVTEVIELRDEARREEIARMLSGEKITPAARAQADELLQVKTVKSKRKAS